MSSAGLRIDASATGAVLRVRVVPGARREGVLGLHGAELRVAVRAAAREGRANEAVLAVLALYLELPARDLSITSGATARSKGVLIRGATPAGIRVRIERAGRDPDRATTPA